LFDLDLDVFFISFLFITDVSLSSSLHHSLPPTPIDRKHKMNQDSDRNLN